MADLVEITSQNFDNLLPVGSLLRNNPTVNYNTSGGDYEITDEFQINPNALCIKTTITQDLTGGLLSIFDFGDALKYISEKSGIHTFSFYFKEGVILANPIYWVNFKVKVFINSILSDELTQIFTFDTMNPPSKRFAQTFYANIGDEVNFEFEILRDSVGNPNPTIELFFTGFQLNFGNNTEDYRLPNEFLANRNDFLISETEWNVPSIVPQTINNGDSFNLLNLINNTTNKNTINSDIFDQLNIISNAIRTIYRGCKIIHTVRIRINIATGSDQHYQLQIRRSFDNSIVYRSMLERNPDETTQTIEMTTRTLNASDPYVVDGFYLAFVNNSGAPCTIDGELNLVIISHYQKSQNGN